MAKKEKTEKKKVIYSHRSDAEWLTHDICSEYVRRARELNSPNGNDVGPRRQLREELQYRCDISELDALNIINGYGVGDYVHKYNKIRAILEGTYTETAEKQTYTTEYLEWLAEKEEKESSDFDEFRIDED